MITSGSKFLTEERQRQRGEGKLWITFTEEEGCPWRWMNDIVVIYLDVVAGGFQKKARKRGEWREKMDDIINK